MDKFTVEKEVQFDAGHRVPQHKSKCRNPHGHRYRVIVGVVGDLHETGSSTGMVMDFGDIKGVLERCVHDKFDHGFIVYGEDQAMLSGLIHGQNHERATDPEAGDWRIVLVDFVPTAEELARHIYYDLLTELNGLAYVKVWETPTSLAIYPVQRVGTVVLEG
jgi:6-pyruvoyltetrahydropterin/6-carboxytetrahydropterin synthase